MSFLVGCLSARADGARAVSAMLAAGRAGRQVSAAWTVGPLALGILDLPPGAAEPAVAWAPARSADGRHWLWFVGAVFAGPTDLPGADAVASQTLAFRQQLLELVSRRGVAAVAAELDGEFQLALWDGREERLTLALDRFAGLPLYWSQRVAGLAFGGRVASVLAAPGVAAEPDLEALREAVTFGGFRLGGRTVAQGVEMLPGAAIVSGQVGRAAEVRRSWHWRDLPATPSRVTLADTLPALRQRWERAVERRLVGAERPGQTLSGGLDSRAILAVAATRGPFWALTYGLAGCDDARFAEQAARAAGVPWAFLPLYQDLDGVDWLERRRRFVLETDGLIDLHDLGHLESIPRQLQGLDVHLSGYIGDAVIGPTFHDVETPEAVLRSLPYLGGPLALPEAAALERARSLVAELQGAPARFALFEHKLPQSTNRWAAAFRPYFRVRKPFTDFALFELCQSTPAALRGPGRWYEHFLRTSYPALFARIPNQKTGLPVLSSPLRHQAERARRFALRTVRRAAGMGVRRRAYTADHSALASPAVWPRFESTVLAADSLAVQVFGRAAVADVLTRFRERGEGPVQTVGALWSFEVFWRDRRS